MKSFIEKLNKAELHMHLEGSLEPAMMLKLADKHKVQLSYSTVEGIEEAYKFNCLQDFLNIYYQGMALLKDSADFFNLTYAYLLTANENQISHAEMFLDIQPHLNRGISAENIFAGIQQAQKLGEKEFGIKSSLIVSFLRDLTEKDALLAFEKIIDFKQYFIGIGLSSTEYGNLPGKFKNLYNYARNEKLHLVAHAGEEAPANYIWEAIDVLGIERIDHGLSAVNDHDLMLRLAKDKIPLTMCPLSNLYTKNIQKVEDFPLRQMLEQNILVTINSDDPAYFGGYINDNYLAIAEALRLSEYELQLLADNSLLAKFA